MAILAGLSSGGLPLSVQLGRYFAERMLFQVDRAWERAAGTDEKHPSIGLARPLYLAPYMLLAQNAYAMRAPGLVPRISWRSTRLDRARACQFSDPARAVPGADAVRDCSGLASPGGSRSRDSAALSHCRPHPWSQQMIGRKNVGWFDGWKNSKNLL